MDEDFIQDQFNMCGLPEIVPNFRAARNRILDIDMGIIFLNFIWDSLIFVSDRSSGTGDGADEQDDELEKNAELLYGLVHARYILTNKSVFYSFIYVFSILLGVCCKCWTNTRKRISDVVLESCVRTILCFRLDSAMKLVGTR